MYPIKLGVDCHELLLENNLENIQRVSFASCENSPLLITRLDRLISLFATTVPSLFRVRKARSTNDVCKSRVSQTYLVSRKEPYTSNRFDCSATWTSTRRCEVGRDANRSRSNRNRRSTTRWARTATRRSAPAAVPSRRITWTTPVPRR